MRVSHFLLVGCLAQLPSNCEEPSFISDLLTWHVKWRVVSFTDEEDICSVTLRKDLVEIHCRRSGLVAALSSRIHGACALRSHFEVAREEVPTTVPTAMCPSGCDFTSTIGHAFRVPVIRGVRIASNEKTLLALNEGRALRKQASTIGTNVFVPKVLQGDPGFDIYLARSNAVEAVIEYVFDGAGNARLLGSFERSRLPEGSNPRLKKRSLWAYVL